MQRIIETVIPVIRRSPFYVALYNRALHLMMPMYRVMGIRVESIADDRITASLRRTAFSRSHVGSIHAAPLFALGECVGGVLVTHRWGHLGWMPIARRVEIEYRKKVAARARVEGVFDDGELQRVEGEVRAKGRAELTLDLAITNESGEEAAVLRATYVVKG